MLAENKICTHGWTFLRSSKGILGGKDMLNKVSFLFIFTLEFTASSSCWEIVSIILFWFPKSVEEQFRISSVLLNEFSKRDFSLALCDLAEATKCLENFFQIKFQSYHCSKSASSLNISLDCGAGQLRAAKMLYLLKYVM